MIEENSVSQINQRKLPANSEMMSLRKIISIIITHKYLFLGTLLSSFALAYLYNTFTIPVYRVGASILIEENKKTGSTGNDQLLEGFGLMPGIKNLDNQTMVLSSRALIGKTLDELDLDLQFYYKGLLNKKSLYPFKPITILTDAGARLPEEVEFAFKYNGNSMFRITSEPNAAFKIDKKVSFGENIDYPGCSFRIEPNDSAWFAGSKNKKFYFKLHSRRNLVGSYVRRLEITRASKLGSIVKVNLEGTNKFEDQAFLSKLAEIFLNISLERKNNEAIRTIQFIDDQLTDISDSLVITENKLQQFRSRNKVMNLSAQGQVIINQAMNLENERARLGIEANYFNYLLEYLEKDSVGESPVAPATIGISDPGLTQLVADLAEQQSRLYSKSMGEKNPLQNQLTLKVRSTKESLKETLKGLRKANDMAIMEIKEQIVSINSQSATLPKTERQLLGIERKYKLNDELYTFLLEKRAVAQMQKTSNVADNEMIDYPEYENNPIKPKKQYTYLFAIFAGFGFPLLFLFLVDIFSFRIRDMEEIIKISDIPVTALIPPSGKNKATLVLDEPDSIIAEAFRLLRSKMIFFTKDIESPVILVTSSMANEGKTFISINLASAYSLMGKKTVLIGFDLRKPSIYSDFGLNNDHGVSTFLIGKDKLENIINKTKNINLHVITAGPVPPNPAELTSLEKTNELIKLLKSKYDCIVIDTPPIGTVSDAFHLAFLADTCILVARQNLTFKDLLAATVKDLKNDNIKNLCLVINDISNGGGYNSYGGIYRNQYKIRPGSNVNGKMSSNMKEKIATWSSKK